MIGPIIEAIEDAKAECINEVTVKVAREVERIAQEQNIAPRLQIEMAAHMAASMVFELDSIESWSEGE